MATLPTTLKLTSLKYIAFKCGISTSGTKPILNSRIQDVLSNPPIITTKPLRVLSIDMGIRNLAYCILDISPVKPNQPQKKPMIHAWHRLAVSSPADKSLDEKPVKEAFDPATLSKTAYTLLRSRLLLEKPTHVLIERQRFRSMGSKHILEWTVRVNMFESILHAVLCTLRNEGLWDGEVQAIAPGKVGPFWVGEEGSGDEGAMAKERRSKNAKIRNKGKKMDLVRGWLENGEMVSLGNDGVEGAARQYKEKWDRAPGGRKKEKGMTDVSEEKMGKLDDLADSLLQGLAWVQWEENKRIARENGVEALLEN